MAIILLIVAILAHSAVIQQVEAIKVDCHPVEGATKENCEALGCIWSPVKPGGPNGGGEETRVGEPWCYFPEDYHGYKDIYVNQTLYKLQRTRPSALKNDVQNITISVRAYHGANILHVSIEDSDKKRFQPELPYLNLGQEIPLADSRLSVNWSLSQDGGRQFLIRAGPELGRGRSNFVMKMDIDKMIFSDQYIQLSCDIPRKSVFGLGEHYGPFRKVTDKYKVYSFYNTDRLPLPGGTRSYGGFPFFVNFDELGPDSMGWGLYTRTSNAMDIVLKPDASMEFRTLGGILDFYIIVGEEPLEVVRQFQSLVGLPALPPRWSLGFHLCRYNYKSLEKTKAVWSRTREAGIPFDVQWNDLDYMNKANDFSYDPNTYAGLPEFVRELHSKHMHYMPLIDPGISQEINYQPYELGTQMDIWIKNATNQTLVGKVWNQSGRTVFPDFSDPKSHEYWARMFVDFHKQVEFDGAWIDMNDISNFVDGSLDGCPWNDTLENPPYLPGGYSLQKHSLCLSARHRAGREYDVHNLYSFYEAIATKRALEAARPGRRSLIISRSTHPGQGHYSGHWSGDVLSNWDYLRWSIPSLIEHSMYGFSMMGSDICGFAGNTTPELCARWSTLGAFYTFSRNHNDDVSIDQDPVALGADVIEANRNALTKRYSLLPYLYTLVYSAHKTGQPVIRSMAFEFFKTDGPKSLEAEHQFMFGPAVMISPVVFENSHSKATYLPAGRWFEADILPASSSFEINQAEMPRVIDIPPASDRRWHTTSNISLANMPIFYRGGHIIPVYSKVGPTVYDTEHGQPVALEVAFGSSQTARGGLVLDDGESTEDKPNYLEFAADDKLGILNIILVRDDYKKQVGIGKVKLLGVSSRLKLVEIVSPDKRRPVPFAQKEHMVIFDLNSAAVTRGEQLSVRWSS